MVDTLTSNYGWTKPDIGGDPSTWGNLLNADLDLIDAQVKTNETAMTKGSSFVGQVVLYAGATPPSGWLLCNGAVYNNTDIPLLAPILNNRYVGGNGTTTSAVPNLKGRTPVGYDGGTSWQLGAQGGEQTHTLATGELPSHNHTLTDPGHIHVDSGHTHTENAHTHGITDPGHHHGYVEPASGTGGAGFPQYNQQALTVTSDAVTGITVNPATATINSATASIQSHTTGITVANAGGGGAHNNLQPYTVLNFIIRYQ